MATRLFDLNIERVLENWEVHHAIREIIANALDEQVLSRSDPVRIEKDATGRWTIRDFGRGLRIEHFTLNENHEKLAADSGVIGKFGVGLKDALATFHRHEVAVCIRSPHGSFRVREARKHDFTGIITLHVEYDDAPAALTGTEFVLGNVADEQVAAAKGLFLHFSPQTVLENTAYGDILDREPAGARVYISGVLASEEANFRFSYNITSLTPAMKKRLNRERLNVGRTTYVDRVKMILKAATSPTVRGALADEVRRLTTGGQCDEMQWSEISQLAITYAHQRSLAVFLTKSEIETRPDILDNLKRDGYEVVLIDDAQRERLRNQASVGGQTVRTAEVYIQEYNDTFRYEFVPEENLAASERHLFGWTPDLLSLVGIDPTTAPPVLISETMRITADNTGGVWDRNHKAVIIKRSCLASLEKYAGVLLHEAAHAMTATVDATRDFETVLTDYLGRAAATALRSGRHRTEAESPRKSGFISWLKRRP